MEQQRAERDEGEAGGLTPHPSGDIRVPVRKRSVQVLGRMMSAGHAIEICRIQVYLYLH